MYRLDDSEFNEVLRRCKSRDHLCTIDTKYLSDIWEDQEGKCIYLGNKLVLPKANMKHKNINPNYMASLDRKDSSKGYIRGNVQFIALTLNYAKNKYDETIVEELIELCKNVNYS